MSKTFDSAGMVAEEALRAGRKGEMSMFEDMTNVLLVVPREVLDRARVFAGAATTRFKRPVSLQMVLRALIDEGLKRDGDRAVLANVEDQVQAVLRIRRGVGRAGSARRGDRIRPPGVSRRGGRTTQMRRS
jgi:hypothetical protein